MYYLTFGRLLVGRFLSTFLKMVEPTKGDLVGSTLVDLNRPDHQPYDFAIAVQFRIFSQTKKRLQSLLLRRFCQATINGNVQAGDTKKQQKILFRFPKEFSQFDFLG